MAPGPAAFVFFPQLVLWLPDVLGFM